jgi:REP element-mobilizing transposase RayT
MTVFNPAIHHRKSIRLKGYDYAQEGLYFITICCQDKAQLFGEIMNGEMILNECGEIANKCWMEIPEHFPNVELHEYIIMPNHVHGIIEIKFKSNVPTVIPSVATVATVWANNNSPLRGLNGGELAINHNKTVRKTNIPSDVIPENFPTFLFKKPTEPY